MLHERRAHEVIYSHPPGRAGAGLGLGWAGVGAGLGVDLEEGRVADSATLPSWQRERYNIALTQYNGALLEH